MRLSFVMPELPVPEACAGPMLQRCLLPGVEYVSSVSSAFWGTPPRRELLRSS